MTTLLIITSYIAGNTSGYEQGMKESKEIDKEVTQMVNMNIKGEKL